MVGTLEDVGTLEVIEVLERLDFDTTCESEGCEKAATWVGRLGCCGFTFVVCDMHRERDERSRSLAAAIGGSLVHDKGERACGHPVRSIAWTPLGADS